jgi:hypothetical protein
MNFLKYNRFLIFLILLICFFAIVPFIRHPWLIDLMAAINYTLMLLSGLYAFSQDRNFLRFTMIFFLFAIAVNWVDFIYPRMERIDTIRSLISALVLALLLIMTLRSILQARSISLNVIFASICGYILIGFLGAFLMLGISVLYPGSYNLSGNINTVDAIYYSFVTMTTLGYGDMLPLSAQSKSLAILLSILGPMYVAILIAMLVGKYSSKPDNN